MTERLWGAFCHHLAAANEATKNRQIKINCVIEIMVDDGVLKRTMILKSNLDKSAGLRIVYKPQNTDE